MPDTIVCARAFAMAVLGSELGLFELMLALVVALALVAAAAKSVMPHREAHDHEPDWTGSDLSRHV
jgi:hypothetical protein